VVVDQDLQTMSHMQKMAYQHQVKVMTEEQAMEFFPPTHNAMLAEVVAQALQAAMALRLLQETVEQV